MSLLIINVSSENDQETQTAIQKLTKTTSKYKVINAAELNISHCIGCCTCMLDTPGVCCIKDDYEEIFNAFFEFDNVIFISDSALNFINHKTINVIHRMFPLVTVLSSYKDGQILHVPRYDKTFRLGLLYKGNPNQELLNAWFQKFANHFSSISMGVFPIEDVEEVCTCMS